MESRTNDFHSFIFCRRHNVLTVVLRFHLEGRGETGRHAHRMLVDEFEGRQPSPATGPEPALIPDVMAADIVRVSHAMRMMRFLSRDQQAHHVWNLDQGYDAGSGLRAAYMSILESLEHDPDFMEPSVHAASTAAYSPPSTLVGPASARVPASHRLPVFTLRDGNRPVTSADEGKENIAGWVEQTTRARGNGGHMRPHSASQARKRKAPGTNDTSQQQDGKSGSTDGHFSLAKKMRF